MAVKIEVGAMKPVFVAPINAATGEWGVYSLPVMIRDSINHDLILRVNGHGDNPYPDSHRAAPDVFFRSSDEGNTWHEVSAEQELKKAPERWKHFFGANERAIQWKDGSWITVAQMISERQSVDGLAPVKQFPSVNRSAYLHVYPYEALPAACKKMTLKRTQGTVTEFYPIEIDDPLLEVVVEAGAYEDNVEEPVGIPEKWKYPCLTSMIQCYDGTLLAAASGQLPEVSAHLCCGVYLYESKDGIHWKRRSVIAENHDNGLTYGYDEYGEISIVQADNGDLLCAIRTEKCVPREIAPVCGTMFTISHDGGYTWEPAREIADSSTTPILTKLENGVIVLSYGRPGVHLMISEDDGKTWSGPYPILGKTLTQELEDGRDYMACKFFDTISYSNVFPVVTGSDSLLLCTTHQKYDPGDGKYHKASVVFPVTVKKQ